MKTLKDFKLRKWKTPAAPYEPVGLVVLVMTKGSEVLRAYRKQPSETKKSPLVYYSERDNQPIEGVIAWDIP